MNVAGRPMHYLKAIWARAYVRVVAANREPSWLITEVALPTLSILAYIFIYRAIGAPQVYESLVVIGGAMMPLWAVVLWSMAAQFYWEKQVGNLDLFMASPTPHVVLLIGMALGGMVLASVRSAGILLLGVIFFGVKFEVTSMSMVVVLFVLTLAALFTLGMAASSAYFMVGRAGIKINVVLMEPVFLLSGTYFPLKHLGFVLGIIGSLIPLSLGLDGIRQLVLPGGYQLGFLSPTVEAIILAAMSVVFFFAALKLMNFMMRKGKEEGKMTLKWQ